VFIFKFNPFTKKPDLVNSSTVQPPTDINASNVNIDKLGSPEIDKLQELINVLESAGKISGGDFTDNGDGSVTVAAGKGLIKTSNSDTAPVVSFEWNQTVVNLTDNALNYIVVKYNNGNPIVEATTNTPTDHNTTIPLGIIYRDGTTLYLITAGQEIASYKEKTLWKDIDVNGKIQYSDGLKISESGTRGIYVTSGSIYTGLTKKNITSKDTNAGDTFTLYYRNGVGGWTKVTGQTQIDNQYYDDGSGTLANLSNNYKACRYIFMDPNGGLHIVMGQNQYSRLSNAVDENVPSDLPDLIKNICILLGKVIVKEGAAHFEQILSAFESIIEVAAVTDHNELTNLQGGLNNNYYHLPKTDLSGIQDGNTLIWDSANNMFIPGSPNVSSKLIKITSLHITSINDLVISGFNGDEDNIYLILLRGTLDVSGTNGGIGLRPNGDSDSANYNTGWVHGSSRAAGGSVNSFAGWWAGFNNALPIGDNGWNSSVQIISKAYVFAKSGNIRPVICEAIIRVTGGSSLNNCSRRMLSGVWLNTSDNITSFTFISYNLSNIDVYIDFYKIIE